MARDFYAVLAVARSATDDQIRQRFRQLARERHPDRFTGEEKQAAELMFQEITQAFNVLSDPELRRQHDLDLTRRPEPQSDPKQVVRLYHELFDRYGDPLGDEFQRARKDLECLEQYLIQLWRQS